MHKSHRSSSLSTNSRLTGRALRRAALKETEMLWSVREHRILLISTKKQSQLWKRKRIDLLKRHWILMLKKKRRKLRRSHQLKEPKASKRLRKRLSKRRKKQLRRPPLKLPRTLNQSRPSKKSKKSPPTSDSSSRLTNSVAMPLSRSVSLSLLIAKLSSTPISSRLFSTCSRPTRAKSVNLQPKHSSGRSLDISGTSHCLLAWRSIIIRVPRNKELRSIKL